MNRPVLLCLALLGCGQRAAAPTPAAVPQAPSPHGFAPSALTPWADQMTAEMLHMLGGGAFRLDIPVVTEGKTTTREPGVTVPENGELVGFQWEVLVHTEAHVDSDVVVMDLALTKDGLFLASVQPAAFLMPETEQDVPGLVPTLEAMRTAVFSGDLAKVGMTLDQCTHLMGDRCLLDGFYSPLLPLTSRYRTLLNSPIERAFVLRAGAVYKQPDGRIADVRVRFVPHEGGIALAGDPIVIAANHGYHAQSPVLPAPSVDTGSIQSEHAWAYFCELDWQRTEAPSIAASRRCITHLDTVGLHGAREASHSTAELEVLRGHIAKACEGDDAPALCDAAAQEILDAEARKRSLVDGDHGSIEPHLAAAWAGKALDADKVAALTDLSLGKIEAAIWLRHGFQLVDPDLIDFFYTPHEGSTVLPLQKSEGPIQWPLSDVDKANLDLVHR